MEAFEIDALIEIGFEIEYWDCTQLFRPGIAFRETISLDYCKSIQSMSGLNQELLKINYKKTALIFPFHAEKTQPDLLENLKNEGALCIRLNIYPSSVNEIHLNGAAWRLLLYPKFYFNLFKYFKSALDKIRPKSKSRHVGSYHAYFSPSQPRTHVINTPTYELYQKTLKHAYRVVSEEYILFLDPNFPLHPEYDSRVDFGAPRAKAYRKSIVNFFDYVEEKYQLPVVVAAHPSSDYKQGTFGDREIIRDRTPELVKFAGMIVAHTSFANILAVLFDKPIAFVVTAQMKYFDDMFGTYKVYNLARKLNKTVFNIDKNYERGFEISKVDPEARKTFIFNEITTRETAQRRNADILADYFIRLDEPLV